MKITSALLCAVTLYSTTVLGQQRGQGRNRGGGGNNDNNNGNGQGQGGQGGNNDNNNNNDQQDGQDGQGNNNDNNNNGGGGNNGQACFSQESICTACASDGNPDPAENQTPSLTSDKNFVDFCDGQELTNGLQKEEGSCNVVMMGQIPAADKMVSSKIISPPNGGEVEANQPITGEVLIRNMNLGNFVNPDVAYYSAPQKVDGGVVTGHSHITCEDITDGELTNPGEFLFFKGLNDAGDGNGRLTVDIDEGFPDNTVVRCCLMNSASNHQLLVMPVAQRGYDGDCSIFTSKVGANQGNNGNGQGQGQGQGNNDNNNDNNDNQQDNQQGNGQGQGQGGNNDNNNDNQQDNQQGNGQGQGQGQNQDNADAEQGQGQGQNQDNADAEQGQGQGQNQDNADAEQGQGQDQNQDNAEQGQGQDQNQDNAEQEQGQGQGGQGQGGQGGGRFGGGRFGGGFGRAGFGQKHKMRFAAREFVS